ncbi:transcriptional regulator GlxA family with amidase domain [Thermocatellispora tengchongensis]|uniref:Transcriptional regulator GlxA family with amidase domain n=1 Tax=Thermocatellispora tengchongensis TaxID=1073253 RepID=A0A840P7S7_9ACTN|nr:DJ-1/PfpI family protein [Thermocatellispora tengchongensis]MBB5137394.1 transcriptional regulator GlxA family with amidase domain [Thermocatellispora tengchongensis]
MRVDIVVFDGVDDLDVVGPYEVLHMAGRAGLGVTVRLVCVDGERSVTSGGGLVLPAEGWAPGDADVLIVPGGGFAQVKTSGVGAELAAGRIPAALAAAARPGLVLASVCTGALLLGAAGLLDGRPCVTHHRAVADLVAAGGRHVAARVVDDGDVVTAGGITSGLDLALWLVERHLGADASALLERVLEYERREPLWRTGQELPATASI